MTIEELLRLNTEFLKLGTMKAALELLKKSADRLKAIETVLVDENQVDLIGALIEAHMMASGRYTVALADFAAAGGEPRLKELSKLLTHKVWSKLDLT